MADVIITFRIMPEDPSIDLTELEGKIKEKITAFEGHFAKSETQPVAFGLKALMVICAYDEKKGSSDLLEEDIASIEGVKSVEVTDVRRAFG